MHSPTHSVTIEEGGRKESKDSLHGDFMKGFQVSFYAFFPPEVPEG